MICNACSYKAHRYCKGCECQHQTGLGLAEPKGSRETLTQTQSLSVLSSGTLAENTEKVEQHL